MKQLFALGSLLVFLASVSAAPQPDPAARRVTGVWRLVEVVGDSRIRPAHYDRPTGLIVYDASGHMAVQIVTRADRKLFDGGPAHGTLEERAAACDSYMAYYGTYTVDPRAGTITHHLDNALLPDLRGRNLVRYFEFQGDNRVVLMPQEDGKGGIVTREHADYKLVWERMR